MRTEAVALVPDPAAALLDGHGVTLTPAPWRATRIGADDGDMDREGLDDEARLVVVAEDNPDMNSFICDALGRLTRRSALDGRQGLELVRSLAARPHRLRLHDARDEAAWTWSAPSGPHPPDRGHSDPHPDRPQRLEARIDILREGANDYLLKPSSSSPSSWRGGQPDQGPGSRGAAAGARDVERAGPYRP